jgi:hypothetical protein
MAATQLDEVLKLIDEVDENQSLAKLALYAREKAFMKDSAMLPEWRNGTPIPERHVFCSEDCGTTMPRVNLGRMCAVPDSYD